MMWSRMGRLAIGTIGFGMLGAASWIRRPSPPQKRTTFIGSGQLRRVLPAEARIQRPLVEQGLQARVGVEGIHGEADCAEGVEKLEHAVAGRPDRLRLGKGAPELRKIDPIAPRIGSRSF